MPYIIKRGKNEEPNSGNLSRGGRDYIRRQGISDSEFDKMKPLARKQWAEEAEQIGAYEENLKR